MTKSEAYRIIHPATHARTIREYDYENGVYVGNGKKALGEAIDIACECIMTCIRQEEAVELKRQL